MGSGASTVSECSTTEVNGSVEIMLENSDDKAFENMDVIFQTKLPAKEKPNEAR